MKRIYLILFYIILLFPVGISSVQARDLEEILKEGKLYHLGIPYARFVTGYGDGLSVELAKGFARYLGVDYVFVKSDFLHVIDDLNGMKSKNGRVIEKKGDIIATGFTVLPWREKLVSFGPPSFPTQVWLISKSESPLSPVVPGESLEQDIEAVKKMIHSISVLGVKGTCLDPELYNLEATGASICFFDGSVNDVAPAVLMDKAKTALLDVPDALVAMSKWPGKFKILGPLSEQQFMAPAFRKESVKLKAAYERYFEKIKKSGQYREMVKKYYPDVFLYYPEFFK